MNNADDFNILDAIVQGTVKRRDLKKLLIKLATEKRQSYLSGRYSEQIARVAIRNDLTEFMEKSHYPRKGLKRLFDQVLSVVMRGYSGQLRSRMFSELMHAERESRGPELSFNTIINQRRADDIRRRLAQGRLGRDPRILR